MYLHREELSIPTNISKYALFSGQVFLLQIYLSFVREQTSVFVASSLLYISTMLHWREPYLQGIIRSFDVCMVWTSCCSISYYIYNHIPSQYQRECFYHFVIVMCWHFINTTLYNYQVLNLNTFSGNDDISVTAPDQPAEPPSKMTERVWFELKRYFSLKYTLINTPEREYAYKRYMITHCAFVHLYMALSILYYCILYGGNTCQIESNVTHPSTVI